MSSHTFQGLQKSPVTTNEYILLCSTNSQTEYPFCFIKYYFVARLIHRLFFQSKPETQPFIRLETIFIFPLLGPHEASLGIDTVRVGARPISRYLSFHQASCSFRCHKR